MSSAVADVPQMTTQEFLDWDGDGHQGKLELVDGIVRAMAPASESHGTIQANLAYLLVGHFRGSGSPCRVVMEACLVPRFNPGHNLRVPDLVVTCAPPAPGSKTVAQPLLLVEVLSPSNGKDTWESLRACATLPSLMEILIVDSQRVNVQLFCKGKDGHWAEKAQIIEAGGTIKLASIGAEFAVDDVYADTAIPGES